ncbi:MULTISPECIES: restriction endonuclease subunit S [Acetobacter]|nr:MULTISPECIES: restriction endonuclease subunit S [Acetobacter]MCG0996462.1 restriction endonuclease subunit S [Acetobacter indonesiensis]
MPTGTNLPKGWSLVQLSQLMKFQNGLNSDKSAYGRGLRFANVLEVITHSHLFANMIPGRVITSVSETNRYLVQKGDLLFNRTSETQEEVGLASVYLDDEPILFGGFVLRGKPISDALDPVFAGYGLRSKIVREQIIAAGQGGIRANIGQQSLSKIKVALPSRLEQKAIAEALSDADTLIEGLERLIAKKRLIKQGAMQELLTGRRRLPGFSGEWKNFRLSEHGKFLSGSGFPLVYQGHSSGDYPFFKVSDFSGESNAIRLTRANHYIDSDIQRQLGARVFPPKAIVFAKIGAAIFLERKRMIAQASCLDNNMAAFVLQGTGLCVDLILAKFQFFALGDLVSSTALPAISSSDLKAIEFFLPKALDEQEAIAGVLNDMDAEIQALEDSLEKAQQIKEGMMQTLLTGQIRLV